MVDSRTPCPASVCCGKSSGLMPVFQSRNAGMLGEALSLPGTSR